MGENEDEEETAYTVSDRNEDKAGGTNGVRNYEKIAC